MPGAKFKMAVTQGDTTSNMSSSFAYIAVLDLKPSPDNPSLNIGRQYCILADGWLRNIWFSGLMQGKMIFSVISLYIP